MRASVFLLVVLVAGACVGQTPSASPISASAATATAIRQAGSTIPVKVLSARLSTYGAAEAGGGTIVDASTPVWAVLLSGSFQPPSCGPRTATPHPCPSPATSALILIDARTGAFIEGMVPAPTSSQALGPRPSAADACASAAGGYAGTVVGSFDTTVGAIRGLEPHRANPARWPGLPPDHAAVLCYIDGQVAMAPPPPASGPVAESFDRVVIGVVDGTPVMIMAGYRDGLPVKAP
jgi:hypothetical protein